MKRLSLCATLIFLVLCVLPVSVRAAITFNNAANCSNAGTVSTLTCSTTVSAGTDKIAIATAAVADSAGGDEGDGVSIVFNGSESFTFACGIDGGAGLRIEKWYLKNPTVTTANTVLTWSGSQNEAMLLDIVILNGVEQTGTPHRTCGTNESSAGVNPTLTLTSAVDDWCVDGVVSWNDSNLTPTAGQTQRATISQVTGEATELNMSTETATGSTNQMGWGNVEVQWHAYVGACYIPEAVAGSALSGILRGTVVR